MGEGAYKGTCFCGAVEISVTGVPSAMGFCHCDSCREWGGAPVTTFTLWKPSQVKVTKGESLLGEFHKTERSYRVFCTRCGGHLMKKHPGLELVDIYAFVLPKLAFAPEAHVFYGEKVISVRDGLPKFKDLPAPHGGSGELLPE